MSLVRNAKTRGWELDLRDRTVGRLHLSLRTTQRAEAERRHAAVEMLVREGDVDLVGLLRRQKFNVEAVARCVREKRPFASLRPADAWPTVREAAASYVAWLRNHPEREAHTAKAAGDQLARFVERFGDLRLDRVPLEDAAAWQAQTIADYAVNTAGQHVTRVGALYRWAARQEDQRARAAGRAPKPIASPLDPDTRPTRKTRRERFLTSEEAARLVAATPDALRCPVACGLLAGLRIEEALHLRPDVDVDLTRDMLVIQRRGQKGEPHYWTPKGGKRREVPIAAALRPILERQLARYATDAYLIPAWSDGAFPMPSVTMRKQFHALVERAGMIAGRAHPAGVVFHTLRHTFAAWLVMRDVNPYRIAKLLGNSLAMVENVYGHLMPTDNRKAVEQLSGAVSFPDDPDATEEAVV